MNKVIGCSVQALLLFCFSTGAPAQDYSVGNWSVLKSMSDTQIAKVINGENSTGVICFISSDSCLAYATMGSKCDDKDRYPLLINSATGAFNSLATCRHLSSTMQILVIDEFNLMVSAFESGGEIGFASPLRSGQFKVVRFSTIGATAAIKDARTSPAAPATNNKSAGSRPQLL